ncbi:hypothetical protein GCM10023231_23900 [Olivibacter ginsenosidimutans]|uniref:Nitrogen fixation protein FixH n=1 Tax=Olivibacter ginsenosidimutans TaxID=1176537 RepID=A0ABP9BHV0_9SPHI
MNWGTKIIIGMGIAMTLVVTAGIYMVSHDTDSLEDVDYYEKGLRYDEVYQQKENVTRDHAKAHVSIQKGDLKIVFNNEHNEGTLRLLRPSDRSLDRKFRFSALRTYEVPIHHLKPGAWRLELEWQHKGKHYLQDEVFYVND